MKTYVAVLSVLFCCTIIFVSPQVTHATFYVDQSYCADCHKHATSRTHEKHDEGEADCNQCHNGSPQSGNVQAGNCTACHEHGDKCYLVDDHNNADCLLCHFECDSPPSQHIETCITCHTSTDLHDRLGHSDCSQCHQGTPQQGNVEVDTCAACHPLGAEGKCNLTNFHDPAIEDTNCLTCHAECRGVYTSTTTTSLTFNHIADCLTCHVVDTLHAGAGHGTCTDCHNDVPRAGNVTPTNCVVCHPQVAPGKCNLVEGHDPGFGADCLTCHSDCGGGPTTTTTSLTYNHIANDCLTCHVVDTLHAGTGHGTCTDCHNDVPRAGNVTPTNCVVCHPQVAPGSCNLVEGHDPGFGADCLSCHTECGGGPTTTTTSLTYNHIANDCLTCHVVDTLHAGTGHGTCTDCHNDVPRAGNVTPTNCVVCHPQVAPGSCNLVEGHDPGFGADCLSCHTECGGGPTTTTTSLTYNHIANDCLTCHVVDTLHAGTGHGTCTDCHNDVPRAGNVTPTNCVVCHPQVTPGSCNLVEGHDPGFGADCLSCHTECGTGSSSTTTILLWNHMQYNCLDCHIVDALHGGVGHANCAVCHNGPPQLDNVIPLNCVVCHPLTDPGECNLVRLDVHQGNTCFGCHDHFECRDTTTTTTAPTTTTTIATTTTTIEPTTTTTVPTTTTTEPTTTTTEPTTTTTEPTTTTTTGTDSDDDGIPDDTDICPNTPNPGQEDTYPPGGNGIGDACECEGDFNCSGGVDADDVIPFLNDFGRSTFNNPCVNDNQCTGDFDCNGGVDATDLNSFLEDFGRNQFFNPCPSCETGNWCSY